MIPPAPQVIYVDLLPKRVGQRGRNEAAEGVGTSACGERHDEPDRPGRPGLCVSINNGEDEQTEAKNRWSGPVPDGLDRDPPAKEFHPSNKRSLRPARLSRRNQIRAVPAGRVPLMVSNSFIDKSDEARLGP